MSVAPSTDHLRAWWALSRPRLAPFVLGLVGLGFGWAHWDRALPLTGASRLGWVLASWLVLHMGTLWLNAFLDRDDGPVFFGEPAPVPPGTARLGFAALGLAVLLAVPGGSIATWASAISAALAIAYSRPANPWKGHYVAGPAVNVLGYGVLSPVAGWSVVQVPLNPRTVAIEAVVVAGVLGAYFLAQAFQEEDDRARGYDTFVARHGAVATVTAARLAFGAAWAIVIALTAVGWLPRTLLLAVPAGLLVDRRMARWGRSGAPAEGVGDVARALTRTTVLAGLLVTWPYVADSLEGRPVAGLGTVAGHPTDRPIRRAR